MLANSLDRELLRREFLSAKPFPHIKIDNFLADATARKIVQAYPSFDAAWSQGRSFNAVNERRKVQITDSKKFAKPVAELNDFLASAEFLADLAYITNIPTLLADADLVGGGIHITGPGGHLDVHIDFNYMESRKLHRRLNLLLYLNESWEQSWGGQIQLWDKDVKICEAAFSPAFNRCVIFETSDISYHGVTPISPAAPLPRKSFAAYYYTREAPPHWDGKAHSTVFKARPDEKIKGYILMPAESAKRVAEAGVRRLKGGIKSLIGD